MTNTQLLVRHLLHEFDRHQWSIQGFGMLRLYLSKEVRLHIWHSAFKVPNVSEIHDHPWDFESEVVCGELTNQLYVVLKDGPGNLMVEEDRTTIGGYERNPCTHHVTKIRCGPGGGVCESEGPPEPRLLLGYCPHTYLAGESYAERAVQVHETKAVDGTVTIVRRTFKADTEHARVFFPLGTEWVSAEPRPALPGEVAEFAMAALDRLEGREPRPVGAPTSIDCIAGKADR